MTDDEVSDFLQTLADTDPARGALVLRLHKLILSVDTKIQDSLKYGGILYTAGAPFCGVFSHSGHVLLEFSRGAALADIHQVLEGQGSKRRHIKLTSGDDLFKKNIRHYVGAACAAARSAARPPR